MRKKLFEVYAKLKAAWKPATGDWMEIEKGRLSWPADSPYEIAIGAILTQNTNWKNVEKAIANLKKEKLIDEKKILDVDLKALERLIRPSGFYKQKAKRLKTMTKTYLKLLKMDDLQEMRKLLLETHGIGKETADSIILYAFGKPVFVVDAYTKRFCKKFFKKEFKTYDQYQEFFEKNLPGDVGLYKEYHALIVEWAKSERKAIPSAASEDRALRRSP